MALQLPYQQTQDRQFNQYQQSLVSALLPITSLPNSQSIILKNITLLSAGPNSIPTKLNRPLSGWYVIRLRANATVWDSQDSNSDPQMLVLNTSADVVVDLILF